MLRFLVFVFTIFVPTVAAALDCDTNQYINGDYCYTCPANATCNGTEFTCNPGWYKDADICTKCGVENASCTGSNDYICFAGFYDTGSACATCPVNAYCAGGNEYFYCIDGYYKNTYNNTTQCLSCANHTCDGETLISCGAGYWLYGDGRCMDCGANSYCPAGSVVKRCAEGYYFDNGNSSCQVCPAGYYCPLGESIYQNKFAYCAPGYYRTGNSCSPCDTGTVCPGGKIADIVCPDGLYKHDNGQCLIYAPGDCGDVPNCNPGCYDVGDTCTVCRIANATCASADEYTCLAGYYDNGTSCVLCPDNSDCVAGSTEITCVPGYYLDNDVCKACTTGYYCHDNIRYSCPAGVFGENIIGIPDGYTFLKYHRVYTTPPTAATNWGACRMLYIHFATSQGTAVVIASKNYDGSKYEIVPSSDTYWYAPAAGYYLYGTLYHADTVPTYTKIRACTNGPENSYYSGSGTPSGNDCPWVCNDGFYRDGMSCAPCPDGMNCAGGGIVCPIGFYADQGTCISCPVGYVDAQKSGAQSPSDCQIKCPGGSYIASPESAVCQIVGSGFWVPENYTNFGNAGHRNSCADGLKTPGLGAGADDAADCGHILHFGLNHVYLRSEKRTSPSLCVDYHGQTFYGDMGISDMPGIKILYNNQTYTVYDDTMTF